MDSCPWTVRLHWATEEQGHSRLRQSRDFMLCLPSATKERRCDVCDEITDFFRKLSQFPWTVIADDMGILCRFVSKCMTGPNVWQVQHSWGRRWCKTGDVCKGYSSMFRRSYVQKVLCSEGSMFRRSFVQKVLCSEGSMFRRFYIQKVLCSEGPMFRNICSEGPMFRKGGWLFEWLRGKVI